MPLCEYVVHAHTTWTTSSMRDNLGNPRSVSVSGVLYSTCRLRAHRARHYRSVARAPAGTVLGIDQEHRPPVSTLINYSNNNHLGSVAVKCRQSRPSGHFGRCCDDDLSGQFTLI
jgi:hypothetical protein